MKLRNAILMLTVSVALAGCNKKPEIPTPIPASAEVVAEPTPTLAPAALEEVTPLPAEEPVEEAAPVASSGKSTTTNQEPTVNYWTPTRSQMKASLNRYGRWTTTTEYGAVWTPTNVSATWRPYTAGHWISADEQWIWQSSEPWGWLPYHYGSWVLLPRVGWAWVPGDVWMPANVAWRSSNGYVAWAPLPPGRVEVSTLAPAAWVMVPTARFLDTKLVVHIVPPAKVRPLLTKTTVITHTRPYGKRTVYIGPRVTVVKRWGVAPHTTTIQAWRRAVPARYKVHYDEGVRLGWYRRVTVKSTPHGTRKTTTIHRPAAPRAVAPARPRHDRVEDRRERRRRALEDRPKRVVHGDGN